MKTILLASLIVAAAAVPMMAGAISDTYVIPAAAHTRGAGGELWQSDLMLFNPNASPVNIDAEFIDASGAVRALGTTISIAPNASIAVRDAVGSTGGNGAIVLSGDQAFVVSSRAYATTAGGTFGESVAPAAEFIDELSSGAFVTGLTSNVSTRTNIGVFAAADRNQPMTVAITILDGNGGAISTRTLTVPAGGLSVMQMPLAAMAPGTLEMGSAQIRITGGSGIATAYASVIDNATSDSTFIPAASGILPPGRAAAKLRSHFE